MSENLRRALVSIRSTRFDWNNRFRFVWPRRNVRLTFLNERQVVNWFIIIITIVMMQNLTVISMRLYRRSEHRRGTKI